MGAGKKKKDPLDISFLSLLDRQQGKLWSGDLMGKQERRKRRERKKRRRGKRNPLGRERKLQTPGSKMEFARYWQGFSIFAGGGGGKGVRGSH